MTEPVSALAGMREALRLALAESAPAAATLRRLASVLPVAAPTAVHAAAARLRAAADDAACRAAGAELLAALPGQAARTVLVIDDDPAIGALLRAVLTRAGQQVVLATDVPATRQLLATHAIDLILLDLTLGDADGRNLLVAFKETPATAAIPVIVLSGHPGAVVKAECLALGAAGYFEKPFDVALLTATVIARLAAAPASPLLDPVTGAGSRAALVQALAALPAGTPALLTAVDLDGLTAYNAARGEAAGNALLRQAVAALQATSPAPACVARWAGGTLAVLITGSDLPAATAAVEAARQAFRTAGGGTFSAGVAPAGTGAADEALDEALRCLEEAKAHGRDRTVTPATCSVGSPHRVLLAEDDDLFAALVRHRLTREGLTVECAADGQAALDALAARGCDLLLLDVQMPVLDGLQVLQAVRAQPQHAALPVMLLTGLSADRDIARGLALGASDYLTKPFSPTELAARVRRLLRR